MLDFIAFVYADSTLIAALEIGAVIGTCVGLVAGIISSSKFFKWHFQRDKNHRIWMGTVTTYAGPIASAIVITAFCIVLAAVFMSLMFFAVWTVLPPALLVGVIALAIRISRRRIAFRKLARAISSA